MDDEFGDGGDDEPGDDESSHENEGGGAGDDVLFSPGTPLPVDDGEPEPENTLGEAEKGSVNPKLKKFWQRFVVPKHGGDKDPMSEDEMEQFLKGGKDDNDKDHSPLMPKKLWPDDISDPMDYDDVEISPTVSPWPLSPESESEPVAAAEHPSSPEPEGEMIDFEDDGEVGYEASSEPDDIDLFDKPVVDESQFIHETNKGNKKSKHEAGRVYCIKCL